jgi:hypothetical protein
MLSLVLLAALGAEPDYTAIIAGHLAIAADPGFVITKSADPSALSLINDYLSRKAGDCASVLVPRAHEMVREKDQYSAVELQGRSPGGTRTHISGVRHSNQAELPGAPGRDLNPRLTATGIVPPQAYQVRGDCPNGQCLSRPQAAKGQVYQKPGHYERRGLFRREWVDDAPQGKQACANGRCR